MASYVSVKSGEWSDPETWGTVGYPSVSGDMVVVSAGHSVSYGELLGHTVPFGGISINGLLVFSRTADTSMYVNGDFVTIGANGALVIGTANSPIPEDYSAGLYFVASSEVTGIDNTSGGSIDIHGSSEYYGGAASTTLSAAWDGASTEFFVDGDMTVSWAPGMELAVFRPFSWTEGDTSWLVTIDSMIYQDGETSITITGAPPVATAGDSQPIGTEVVCLSRNVTVGTYGASHSLGYDGRGLSGNIATCASIISSGGVARYSHADFCGLTRNSVASGLVSSGCVHRNSAFALYRCAGASISGGTIVGNFVGVEQCDGASIDSASIVSGNTVGIRSSPGISSAADMYANSTAVSTCDSVTISGDISGGSPVGLSGCSRSLVSGDISGAATAVRSSESCCVSGDIFSCSTGIEDCIDIEVSGKIYDTTVALRGADSCRFSGDIASCGWVAADSENCVFTGPVYANIGVALSSCNFLEFRGIAFGYAPGDVYIPNGSASVSFAGFGNRRHRFVGCTRQENGSLADWTGKGRLESVRGVNSAITSVDDGGTVGSSIAYFPSATVLEVPSPLMDGGAGKTMSVSPLPGLATVASVSPLTFPLSVTQNALEFIEDNVSAITHSRSLYVYLTGWSPLPSAGELYLEAEYHSDPSGPGLSVARSATAFAFNSLWTRLSVEFSPSQTGQVAYRLVLGKYDAGATIFVDGALYDDSGVGNLMSWSDGIPVVNCNLFPVNVTPGSGEEAVVAFDPTDVGLGIADINWDFCFDNVTEQAVSISGATLSGKGDGVYILKNPNVAHSTTFRVHIVADGELKYAEGLFMASGGIGDESEIYLWREYEAGHNGDPAYAVPDVTVVAYSNDTASGDPITSGITDETGTAKLYLDPGTYYLFRRKSGWTFTNPQTIEVVNV